ncbi:UNVERIFIED_CONTAM: hypothetical protein GTU68_027496 [Idotea baltica]|nr:hypothetical protein [Idotea baltica]
MGVIVRLKHLKNIKKIT